jgi:hypothetical protein
MPRSVHSFAGTRLAPTVRDLLEPGVPMELVFLSVAAAGLAAVVIALLVHVRAGNRQR